MVEVATMAGITTGVVVEVVTVVVKVVVVVVVAVTVVVHGQGGDNGWCHHGSWWSRW